MMVIASSYPFLNIFWTMLIFFAWVVWIWIAVTVLVDVFRRHDLSGWGKAGWTVLVIVLPFLGVLSYLIIHSGDMAERGAERSGAINAPIDDRARSTAGESGAAAEIEKAKQLLENGTITQAEFDSIKAKALA